MVVRDARVATDAAEDAAPDACLHGKLRVSDQRARHANRVHESGGDQPLGVLGVDDARGGDQRGAEPEAPDVRRDHVLFQRGRGTIPTEPRYVEESPSATDT